MEHSTVSHPRARERKQQSRQREGKNKAFRRAERGKENKKKTLTSSNAWSRFGVLIVPPGADTTVIVTVAVLDRGEPLVESAAL
jgi:hypothetical protein